MSATLLAHKPLLRVALPVPLRQMFDYWMPEGAVCRGQRVRVPFGNRQLIGIAVESVERSDVPDKRIRPVSQLLEDAPVPGELLDLLLWAARYYHHPPGEALMLALPPALRRQAQLRRKPDSLLTISWLLSDTAPPPASLARAPRQRQVLAMLADNPEGMPGSALEVASSVLKILQEKSWIVPSKAPSKVPPPDARVASTGIIQTLSAEQRQAADAIIEAFGKPGCLLLEGVTGSGKTEVYLGAIEHCLQQDRQALVLVPEIGLTPQVQRRFEERFPGQVAVIHSGVSAAVRRDVWLDSAQGQVSVLLGTRAALFTPMPRLGLVVVDEEHDSSYKQQEGFRYSARNLAIKRATNAGIPVVLGSATPSLESLANLERKGYHHLRLMQRASGAPPPAWRLLDLRSTPKTEVLAVAAIQKMREHLMQDGQVLLFINRRGLAPVLMCKGCGWTQDCDQCDARMVLHRAGAGQYMLCHHCTRQTRVPDRCGACRHQELLEIGAGAQKFEAVLKDRFPDYQILRFDADVSQAERLKMFSAAQCGKRQILVGTQMLTKGHDFPNLTLAVVADADAGLFAADFRAAERMAQLITQTAGRAGRLHAGQVIIQTRQPDHPVLQLLLHQGYEAFARHALAERQQARLPPYTHLALFRAEAKTPGQAQAQLAALATLANAKKGLQDLEVWGPAPAPMERRIGLFRQQLMLCASNRNQLQTLLGLLVAHLESGEHQYKSRWSVEVDPIDTY